MLKQKIYCFAILVFLNSSAIYATADDLSSEIKFEKFDDRMGSLVEKYGKGTLKEFFDAFSKDDKGIDVPQDIKNFLYQYSTKYYNPSLVKENDRAEKKIFSRKASSNNLWGLDRINQRSLPLDGNTQISLTGKGVDVYILDTGIDKRHSEFDNVRFGYEYDFVEEKPEVLVGRHGTAVTSIIAGKNFGVAKGVTVHLFRINEGGFVFESGEFKGLESAINEIAKRHPIGSKRRAVVNMSLSGKKTANNLKLWNFYLNKLFDLNIPVVVGAGNDYHDACDNVPAAISKAITVAASNKDDEMWVNPSSDVIREGSNYGQCIDIFAPGKDIEAARYVLFGYDFSSEVTGTSFSTPYVTGVVALYLEVHPKANLDEINNFIINSSSKGKLKSIMNSPNRLLYTKEKKVSTEFKFENIIPTILFSILE